MNLVALLTTDCICCPADDLLYETLTVFETLYFAAMLRLPTKMTASEKEERVNTVIKTLGLGRCKDTIVGGGFRRGVSGGERKRVSIGHELLINPSAIFLGMFLLQFEFDSNATQSYFATKTVKSVLTSTTGVTSKEWIK